jgi:hypothetical protein
MEQSGYHDTPIRKVLLFIRSVGLIKGWSRRGSTKDLEGQSVRAG